MNRLAITALVAACSSAAGEPAVPEPAPPAYLAGTDSRVILSTSTGRRYQVSVSVPRGYEGSASRYPVLYSLDANGTFGTVVETARMLQLEGVIPELLIVGVGYPVGHHFETIGKRALDLTVTEDRRFEADFLRVLPHLPALEGTGGAPAFLRFLKDELIPTIEADYRVDPRDRALFGHSFGGLFALHALLHGEGAFQRYIISSPTLWWDDGVSFEHEAAHAARSDALAARAFLSVGLLEPDAPTDLIRSGGYVTMLTDLVEVLSARRYDGFEWTAHFFEDELHASVMPPAVSRGLRYIYGGQ